MTDKKLPTFGDLPQEIQDACWENDPHELPWTDERRQRAEQGSWESLAEGGYSPEKIYPNDPEQRAAMRAYLRTVKP